MIPKIVRRVGAFVWLVWNNLSGDQSNSGLTASQHSALIGKAPDPEVLWSVPVVTGREGFGRGPFLVDREAGRGTRNRESAPASSLSAELAANLLHRTAFRCPAGRIGHERGLLGEKLAIYDTAGTFLAHFCVPRGQGSSARTRRRCPRFSGASLDRGLQSLAGVSGPTVGSRCR